MHRPDMEIVVSVLKDLLADARAESDARRNAKREKEKEKEKDKEKAAAAAAAAPHHHKSRDKKRHSMGPASSGNLTSPRGKAVSTEMSASAPEAPPENITAASASSLSPELPKKSKRKPSKR